MIQKRRSVWIVEITVALYVGIYLYTAIDKLRDFTGFAKAMLHSPLLKDYSIFLSAFIPLIELICVFFLIIPRDRIKGLIFSTALMSVLTVYISYMLATSSDLPCTCGGVLEYLTWPQHILLNSFFLIAGLASILLARKQYYHDKQEQPNTCIT